MRRVINKLRCRHGLVTEDCVSMCPACGHKDELKKGGLRCNKCELALMLPLQGNVLCDMCERPNGKSGPYRDVAPMPRIERPSLKGEEQDPWNYAYGVKLSQGFWLMEMSGDDC